MSGALLGSHVFVTLLHRWLELEKKDGNPIVTIKNNFFS